MASKTTSKSVSKKAGAAKKSGSSAAKKPAQAAKAKSAAPKAAAPKAAAPKAAAPQAAPPKPAAPAAPDPRLAQLEQTVRENEARARELEQKASAAEQRAAQLEQKARDVESRSRQIEQKAREVEDRARQLEQKAQQADAKAHSLETRVQKAEAAFTVAQKDAMVAGEARRKQDAEQREAAQRLERELQNAQSALKVKAEQLAEKARSLDTAQVDLEAAREEARGLRGGGGAHSEKSAAVGTLDSAVASLNDSSKRMSCPRCSGSMTEYQHEVVRADRCDQCHGIFFDNGELEQVVSKAVKDHESQKPGGWFSSLFGKREKAGEA